MEDYERVILVKSDVFIYKIPPLTTNRAHRAADWKLDAPDWNGRLRVVAKGKQCILKLEEKASGQLFGKCPIDTYPGIAIESVSDSSRYFVVRLQDDNGRNAFIGIGFSDRGDSFDLNVALQDHFKLVQKEEQIENEPQSQEPKLDLGFKEGQTIKVNLNIAKKSGPTGQSSRPKAKPMAAGSGLAGLLPPPPSGAKIGAPNVAVKPIASTVINSKQNDSPINWSEASQPTADDLLLDLNSLNIDPSVNTNPNKSNHLMSNNDLWSDFESNTEKLASVKQESNSWTQF